MPPFQGWGPGCQCPSQRGSAQAGPPPCPPQGCDVGHKGPGTEKAREPKRQAWPSKGTCARRLRSDGDPHSKCSPHAVPTCPLHRQDAEAGSEALPHVCTLSPQSSRRTGPGPVSVSTLLAVKSHGCPGKEVPAPLHFRWETEAWKGKVPGQGHRVHSQKQEGNVSKTFIVTASNERTALLPLTGTRHMPAILSSSVGP